MAKSSQAHRPEPERTDAILGSGLPLGELLAILRPRRSRERWGLSAPTTKHVWGHGRALLKGT